MKITIEEEKRLQIAIKFASAYDVFIMLIWSIFLPKRFERFVKEIAKGKSWIFAKRDSKL